MMDEMNQESLFGPPPSHYTGNLGFSDPTQPILSFPGIPTQASMLVAVDKLKFFLATAPSRFDQSPYDPNDPVAREERCLNRFQLPTGELISCVLWNGLYHVTGTDIVRVLHFRFAAFGRPVRNPKKFEEGIFSDLRNLKSGTDATLEEPKSEFLELLFKYNCIRTQKKQKVFYWFSVPHDRLFLDALDRDLKREKLGVEPTTEAVAEPALSFVYNPSKSLFEQFTEQQSGQDGDSEGLSGESQSNLVNPDSAVSDGSEPPGLVVTEASAETSDPAKAVRKRPFHITTGSTDGMPHGAIHDVDGAQVLLLPSQNGGYRSADTISSASSAGLSSTLDGQQTSPLGSASTVASGLSGNRSAVSRTLSEPQASAIFGAFTLFEGSPTYKQRRKPGQKRPSPSAQSTPQGRRAESMGSRTSVSPMPGQGFESDHVPRPTSACDLGGSAMAPAHDHHGMSTSYHSGGAAMIGAPHSAPVTHTFAASGLTGEHALDVPGPFPNLELNTAPTLQDDGSGNPAKIYVCPLFSCGRLFKRLEHLKRHLRIHTEEKPYPCTRCEKRFARSDNLAAHLKIHDKFSARSGSACAAEKAALDAEDDMEERNFIVMAENYDPSNPANGSPSNLNPHAAANGVASAPYFVYHGQAANGLPTPPTAHPDHQWGHYGYAQVAPHVLTPDPSPDPSAPRGSMGPPSRQMSMEVGHCQSGALAYPPHMVDSHRHRSETPMSSQQRHDSYDVRRSYLNGHPYSGQDVADDGAAAAAAVLSNGVSPMMSSFQQQLNMVNSLHDEIASEHHQQHGIGITGPYYAGAAGLAGAAEGSVGLGLMRAAAAAGAGVVGTASSQHPNMGHDYHMSSNAALTHHLQPSLHASMPPPARPASSYPDHGYAASDANYAHHHAHHPVHQVQPGHVLY